MKITTLIVFGLIISKLTFGQEFKQEFISADIDNFWAAYEKITSTSDTLLQEEYLRELYINKGTEGLKSLMHVRNYTENDYLTSINKYPSFWTSIKSDLLTVSSLYDEIEKDIQKLKMAYSDLKPVPVYFSVGSFRTGGTVFENKVLIGSEMALTGQNTIIDELPENLQGYYQTYENAEKDIALLCTHEYIHTQQKQSAGYLLSNCLYEGIAEFISCKVTGKKSTAPAIQFGKNNQEIVVEQFVKDLYLMSNDYNWLYGRNNNHLKVRDLGYYIGYEIVERYYNMAKDKSEVIKELIEFDYSSENELIRLVDSTKLFPRPLQALYNDYEKQRPTVISIAPFKNRSKKVKPGLTKITISFSEPLNGYNTGIDYGPSGAGFFPELNPNRIWSADKKSITIEADLQPGKSYEFVIDNTFRKDNQVRLKPYLIEFKTKKK